MINQVKEILNNRLPKTFNISVVEKNSGLGGNYLKIAFSPNTTQINDVTGQFPQLVSLRLDLDSLELKPQIYGGNGGQCVYRDIDPNNEAEKFYAMKSIKVPFRKPKKEEKNVLNAIDKFCINYLKTLKTNLVLLRYKNLVDYSFLND